MRNRRMTPALLAVSVAGALFVSASNTKPLVADDDDRRIAIRDDCDPDGWPGPPPVGGCELEDGDVTVAEFRVELGSTLAPTSVIGHQAWRNDPPYLKIQEGETVKVRNRGGRTHTFTEVANFGGGKALVDPLLNKGLVTAPECPASTNMPPGASTRLEDLAPGNHRFQCCIHPWMRAIVKVKAEDDEEDDDDDDED